MAKGKKAKKSDPAVPDGAGPGDTLRRPGSAVSQQFLPKKQQNATNDWRKHQQQSSDEQNVNNNNTYGYVPFKTAPLPIYGIRTNNNKSANSNGSVNNNSNSANSGKLIPNNNKINNNNNRAPYPTSAYAPYRADSAMSARTAAGAPFSVESRAGSELGMYKSSSRYQSYTTLPRPEHIDIDVEDLRHHHQQQQQQKQQQHLLYGPVQQPIYGGVYDVYGAALKGATFSPAAAAAAAVASKSRPPSVGGAKAPGSLYAGAPLSQDAFAHGAFAGAAAGGAPQVADEIGRAGLKPVVNWNILNLSSYLQLVLAAGLIGSGILRLFLKLDHTKSYELAYGASALLAAVVGLLAGRQRGYALVFVASLLSVINALFFLAFPLQSEVLPLLWGGHAESVATSAGAPALIDAFEIDMATAVLSLLEFMTAAVATFYGCKTLGAMASHVETLRLWAHYYGGGGFPGVDAADAPPYFSGAVYGYRAPPPPPPQLIPYARGESATGTKRPL